MAANQDHRSNRRRTGKLAIQAWVRLKEKLGYTFQVGWSRARKTRLHERGPSLAAETAGCAGEQSRLKAGCSQDWLPHKALC
jgi:hypothetical protein